MQARSAQARIGQTIIASSCCDATVNWRVPDVPSSHALRANVTLLHGALHGIFVSYDSCPRYTHGDPTRQCDGLCEVEWLTSWDTVTSKRFSLPGGTVTVPMGETVGRNDERRAGAWYAGVKNPNPNPNPDPDPDPNPNPNPDPNPSPNPNPNQVRRSQGAAGRDGRVCAQRRPRRAARVVRAALLLAPLALLRLQDQAPHAGERPHHHGRRPEGLAAGRYVGRTAAAIVSPRRVARRPGRRGARRAAAANGVEACHFVEGWWP